MLPFIEILGRKIGTYSILAFIGFMVCSAVITFSCKKINVHFEDSLILVLVTAGGLLVGGHLFYGITNINYVIEAVSNIKDYSFNEFIGVLAKAFGGMVFYGGFIGGLVSLGIYKKFSKEEYKKHIFDLYAFSIPLFHFFGRIGCFFAGCCYGIESKFGFAAHGNTVITEVNDVKRLPISLIEALLNLLIFVLIYTLWKKGKFKNNLIFVYMILYPIVRFTTEFFRGDEIRGVYFGVSFSQWISIILFAVSVIRWFYLFKNKKTTEDV